ncbi:MAG: response regulator [Sphingorhabdus sp.]
MIDRLRALKSAITPEQEILANRLVLGSAAGLICVLFFFDPIIFAAFLGYLAFNATLFGMQKYDIWRPEERWFAAIILDVMMGFAVMLREPEHMSVFYPLFLWIILGNGFRFGLKYLFIAAALSTAVFATVVAATDYWQQNLTLGISLTAALMIIPAYCSTLIKKLSHAKEQAETASRAKSYFLASVSHELRTPLNAIIGYGNHLRQIDMPRNQHEMIEASVLAGEHLLHLIEQLIQVSKAGAGSATIKKVQFKPTDLLTEVRDIMTIRVEEKGLQFHLQAEPLSDRLIEGPKDVLSNILLNLTGNAIKFTDAGSISICGGLKENNGTAALWFTVSDTGIGIADEAVGHIFQPFQQADETVMNRFGGTGLGLAICKQLVEQVGGAISVSSAIGHGSTFHVTIPVEMTAAADAVSDSNDLEIIRILSLGEFEPDLLAGAQAVSNFVIRHINCASVSDIRAAIASVQLHQFNVVMIGQKIAVGISPDDVIWTKFADAEVAAVMVADENAVDLDDLTLRAAFASVIPPSPNFNEMRSAIRIGSSFARHLRIEKAESVAEVVPTEPRSILVADDNRTNRNVLSAILETVGHKVTMVTDGNEAIDALEQGGFDILLLDVNMPRLNGIDACHMWRQIEGGRQHIPIIGVTADATSETEQRCINAGMDMRLTKPVDSKLLLSTIEKYCSTIPANPGILNNAAIADPLNVVVPLQSAISDPTRAIDPAQMAYLRSIGDDNFVAGMIEGFFDDVEQSIGPIRSSVDQKDVREFRFHAHAFKSSANNMGAVRLAALCGKLEKITEADFLEYGSSYLEKIENELASATAELQYPAESGSVKAAIR